MEIHRATKADRARIILSRIKGEVIIFDDTALVGYMCSFLSGRFKNIVHSRLGNGVSRFYRVIG